MVIAYFVVVNHQDINEVLFIQFVFIDADNDIGTRINFGLLFSGSGLDFQLSPAAFNRFGHAAHRIDFEHNLPRFIGHLLRQVFHHEGAGPGIDHARNVGFFLQNELGVARNSARDFRRQGNGFIKGIGVQRLGATKHGRHGLDGRAHHIVIGILFS